MSDLAPFVAAALLPQNDAVLRGQQNQIHVLHQQVRSFETNVQTLQRRLQERNPLRGVQIQGPFPPPTATPDFYCNANDKEVLDEASPDSLTTTMTTTTIMTAAPTMMISEEWNVEQASQEYKLDLFPDHDDVHSTLGVFLQSRLVIDGQTAIGCLGQALTFTTMRFAYCAMIQLEYLYVRAHLSSSAAGHNHYKYNHDMETYPNEHNHDNGDDDDDDDDPNFVVHLYIAPVTCEEYCRATGVTDPDTAFVATGCIHTRDETDRIIPLAHLHALAHKPIKISFDEGSCQAKSEFLFDHLQVPYVP